MQTKAMLIVPKWRDKWYKTETGSRELLGVQYLSAMLNQKDIKHEIVNAYAYGIDNNIVVNEVIKKQPEIVGISCLSQRSYPGSRDLVNQLRQKGYKGHICFGGNFPSLKYKEIMSDNEMAIIDSIIVGEGEHSFTNLVEYIIDGKDFTDIPGLVFREYNNKIIFNPTQRIIDIDDLPFPERDINVINMLPEKKRSFRIFAGRGCYGKCRFCCNKPFLNNKRRIYKSANKVVDEIQELVTSYNINYFWFSDDIFYDLSKNGKKFITDFIREIKERDIHIIFNIMLRVSDIEYNIIKDLKSIGLNRIFLGVENGVQRILDELGKGFTVSTIQKGLNILKECGIKPVLGWIAIIPTISFEELKESYRFLFDTELYIERNIFNKLNVYSGCDYENLLEKQGLLIKSPLFYERHNFKFKDRRVEYFTELLDKTRKELKEINITLYEFDNIDLDTNQTKNFLKLEVLFSNLWRDLIIILIEFMEKDINFKKNFEKAYFKVVAEIKELFFMHKEFILFKELLR